MRNYFVPLHIWRNRQGVAETDVAITKFYCMFTSEKFKCYIWLFYEILKLKKLYSKLFIKARNYRTAVDRQQWVRSASRQTNCCISGFPRWLFLKMAQKVTVHLIHQSVCWTLEPCWIWGSRCRHYERMCLLVVRWCGWKPAGRFGELYYFHLQDQIVSQETTTK
jgi:hypothetical protein